MSTKEQPTTVAPAPAPAAAIAPLPPLPQQPSTSAAKQPALTPEQLWDSFLKKLREQENCAAEDIRGIMIEEFSDLCKTLGFMRLPEIVKLRTLWEEKYSFGMMKVRAPADDPWEDWARAQNSQFLSIRKVSYDQDAAIKRIKKWLADEVLREVRKEEVGPQAEDAVRRMYIVDSKIWQTTIEVSPKGFNITQDSDN